MNENKFTIEDAKKVIRKKRMPKGLEQGFVNNGMENKLESVYARTAQLLEENKSADKELKTHLEQILPCIAFYEALLRITDSRERALEYFDEWALSNLREFAEKIPKIMNFAGLYKQMPKIFDKMIGSMFSEEAGFEHKAVSGAKCFARDTVKCPYFETCKKYGCPEITQFFCKSDDIMYGNLHPKLVWGRTQTLGTGGECCDFRLYIKAD